MPVALVDRREKLANLEYLVNQVYQEKMGCWGVKETRERSAS